MSDLIEFLTARLDEEEREASHPRVQRAYSARFLKSVVAGFGFGPDVVAFHGRHDPARVLADVEAKRLRIEANTMIYNDPKMPAEARALALTNLQCELLPYADHPAFQASWCPERLLGSRKHRADVIDTPVKET